MRTEAYLIVPFTVVKTFYKYSIFPCKFQDFNCKLVLFYYNAAECLLHQTAEPTSEEYKTAAAVCLCVWGGKGGRGGAVWGSHRERAIENCCTTTERARDRSLAQLPAAGCKELLPLADFFYGRRPLTKRKMTYWMKNTHKCLETSGQVSGGGFFNTFHPDCKSFFLHFYKFSSLFLNF